MNENTIRYGDLSGWLKFAFIWTLINASVSALMFFIYAIIGVSLIE